VDISNGYQFRRIRPWKPLVVPDFRAAGFSGGLGADMESFYYKAGFSRTQESKPVFTLTFALQKG
jgi:hypothetical protein